MLKRDVSMKTIASLLTAAILVFAATSAMADADDAAEYALNWAAVGGRAAFYAAHHVQVRTNRVDHRRRRRAYD
jgi:hypothetical protein